jgi:hypothetical protein
MDFKRKKMVCRTKVFIIRGCRLYGRYAVRLILAMFYRPGGFSFKEKYNETLTLNCRCKRTLFSVSSKVEFLVDHLVL